MSDLNEQLAALKAAAEAATPGPWAVGETYVDVEDGAPASPETVVRGWAGRAAVAVCLDFGENNPSMRDANAAFVAAANPVTILALIAEVEAARRAPAAAPIVQSVGEYNPGSWFEARTLDEMQVFYLSRLPAIREAAKEHGYAIGLHGSARRDFDLMAMQWREGASDKDTLAREIADAACGIRREGAYDWEQKSLGRVATSIPVCWTAHDNADFDKPSVGHIDLSIIDFPAPTMSAADAKAARLANAEVFDIASKFFVWNSTEGWRKATLGTIDMVSLLTFAKEIRAAIAAATTCTEG